MIGRSAASSVWGTAAAHSNIEPTSDKSSLNNLCNRAAQSAANSHLPSARNRSSSIGSYVPPYEESNPKPEHKGWGNKPTSSHGRNGITNTYSRSEFSSEPDMFTEGNIHQHNNFPSNRWGTNENTIERNRFNGPGNDHDNSHNSEGRNVAGFNRNKDSNSSFGTKYQSDVHGSNAQNNSSWGGTSTRSSSGGYQNSHMNHHNIEGPNGARLNHGDRHDSIEQGNSTWGGSRSSGSRFQDSYASEVRNDDRLNVDRERSSFGAENQGARFDLNMQNNSSWGNPRPSSSDYNTQNNSSWGDPMPSSNEYHNRHTPESRNEARCDGREDRFSSGRQFQDNGHNFNKNNNNSWGNSTPSNRGSGWGSRRF